MRVFILLMVLASSCVTYRKCLQKFGEAGTHPIVLKDTVKVEVPVVWDVIDGQVPLIQDSRFKIQDSRLKIQDSGFKIPDSDTVSARSGRAQVKFWHDKYINAIKYRVECLPDTVMVEVPVVVRGDCPDVVVVDPKNAPGWARWWHTYQVIAGWALLLLVLFLFLFKDFFKRA